MTDQTMNKCPCGKGTGSVRLHEVPASPETPPDEIKPRTASSRVAHSPDYVGAPRRKPSRSRRSPAKRLTGKRQMYDTAPDALRGSELARVRPITDAIPFFSRDPAG